MLKREQRKVYSSKLASDNFFFYDFEKFNFLRHGKVLVMLEKSETGFSAFSPDAYGRFTVSETVEDTIANMREALDLYLEATAETGQDLPTPMSLEHTFKTVY